MSLRTTLTLLIVFALLVGVLLLKKDSTQSAGPQTPPTLLGTVDGTFEVEKFDVQHSRSRERTTFERRDGSWWLVEPADRARADLVQYLIEVLTNNQLEVVEKDPSTDRLASAGLEPPLGRVTLYARDGRTLGIRIGEFDPTNIYCYAMVESGDKPVLYRTGANLRNATDKPRQEWRDNRFLIGDAAFLRRVELRRPKVPKIVMEKVGTDWSMLEPRPFEAASSIVNNVLVGGLVRMTVHSFAEASPTQEDMVRYLLDDAHATIVLLDFGSGAPTEVRFGVVGPDPRAPRIAWDSARRVLLMVEGPETLELLERGEKAFRDPRVTDASIGTCRAVKMTLENGELAFELRYDRVTSAFRMENPFPAEIDDTRNGALHPWFTDLRALQAQRSDPGVEREAFLDASEVGGQAEFDRIFDDGEPLGGVIELDLVDRTGAATRERIEFYGGPGSETWLVRTSKHKDVAYVVESRLVEDVLNRDRRTFLSRVQIPADLNRMQTLSVTLADGRSKFIQRKNGGPKARTWYDPSAKDAYTGLLEGWLSKTSTLEAVAILGRDPLPEDGFATPQAIIEIGMSDEEYFGGKYTLEIGATDPSGREVVARSSHLGDRVVFRLEVAIIDELLKVFEGD